MRPPDFFHQDYREILKRELQRRKSHNRLYSLRAFARDLGLSPPRLTEVLNGKEGISSATASRIAARLQLSPTETEYFVTQVESLHARSQSQREVAAIQLNRYRGIQYRQLDLKIMELISSWEYSAICELARVRGFKGTPAWIAKTLQISPKSARECLKTLLDVGLLKKEGSRIVRTEGPLAVPSGGVPSAALRSFHVSTLGKVQELIHTQPLNERDISALVVAIEAKRLPEAKAMIKAFRKKLNERFGQSDSPDSVYSLSIQLVKLSSGLPES